MNYDRVNSRTQQLTLSLLATGSLLLTSTTASALEWTGFSLSDDNWSSSANWLCTFCGGPDNDGSQRVDFGLSTRTTPFVDQAVSISGIRFETLAPEYNISGADLTIGADGITNISANRQRIFNDITLSADQTWGTGGLALLGPEILGTVDLNGHHLTLGERQISNLIVPDIPPQQQGPAYQPRNYTEFRSAGPVFDPTTGSTLSTGLSGTGDITVGAAILSNSNSFTGDMFLYRGSEIVVRGEGSLVGDIDIRLRDSASNGAYPGPSSFFPRQAPSGIVRAASGGVIEVDRITTQYDGGGYLVVESDSRLAFGAGNSSFDLGGYIVGKPGDGPKGELVKVGTGTVNLDVTQFNDSRVFDYAAPDGYLYDPYDAADPYDNDGVYGEDKLLVAYSTAPVTVVEAGTLALRNFTAGGSLLDFRTEGDGTLLLDVAPGASQTMGHSIAGDGTIRKTGTGNLTINDAGQHSGTLDISLGELTVGSDNALGAASTVDLGPLATLNLNGRTLSIQTLLADDLNGTSVGTVNTNGSVLTIGNTDVASGVNSVSGGALQGDGTVIKTGLDSLQLTQRHDSTTFKPSEFNGTLRVEQGAVQVLRDHAMSRTMSVDMAGGTLNLNGFSAQVGRLNTTGDGVVDLTGGAIGQVPGELTIGNYNDNLGESRVANITGLGDVVKWGTGDLVFEGTSDFDGELIINQGNVVLGADNALNSDIIIDIGNGNLNLGFASQRVDRFGFSGSGQLNTDTGEIIIGQRNSFNNTPQRTLTGSAITGNGRIVKDSYDDMAVGSLQNFAGTLVVAQGELRTTVDNGLRNDIDVEVRTGSSNPVIPPTLFKADNAQGFGTITGNGVLEFGRAGISVGNGDKSGTFNGTLRSLSGGAVSKNGAGKIVLDNDQEYRGTTRIFDGELAINGELPTSNGGGAVQLINNDGGSPVLSGSGKVRSITGSGLVSPGESPGILTTDTLSITGLDFAFEFSTTTPDYLNADDSGNDVLRVGTSIFGGINPETDIDLYLDIEELNDGDIFEGGFFTRTPLSPFQLDLANYSVFIADANGSTVFGGENWSALNPAAWDIDVTSEFRRVRFEGDSSLSNGYATRFSFTQLNVVPIPGAVWLFASALLGLGRLRKRT